MSKGMLSTTDNPFNPYTDWDAWYTWDTTQGYGTCAYLARIAQGSIGLPDETNTILIEDAIKEIVSRDLISLVTGGQVHYIIVDPPKTP